MQLECPLVECPNGCNKDLKFHACKLDEHLDELCKNRIRRCVNFTYGCKTRLKSSHLARHLDFCPANIQECPAVRVRRLIDAGQVTQDGATKWIDPIAQQQKLLRTTPESISDNVSLGELLYRIDLERFRKQSIENKFKFNWTYKHFNVDRNSSKTSAVGFDLITNLKIPITSQIFDHIEVDSCILYESLFDLYKKEIDLRSLISRMRITNGCRKCNALISSLEREFFAKLTANLKFSTILRHTYDFNEFKTRSTHKSEDFLKLLRDEIPNDLIKISETNDSTAREDDFDGKIEAENNAILSRVDMSRTFQIQVFDDLFSDSAKLVKHTIFRHKESHYQHKCSVLLKRHQYSSHLNMFHNLIEHNFFDDILDKTCPYSLYGCKHFYRKIKFFSNDPIHDGDLISSDGNLVFNYFKHTDFNFETNSDDDYFLKLPVEVLDLIIERMDAHSIFVLSITSKVRFWKKKIPYLARFLQTGSTFH